jgi:hypothetical protein
MRSNERNQQDEKLAASFLLAWSDSLVQVGVVSAAPKYLMVKCVLSQSVNSILHSAIMLGSSCASEDIASCFCLKMFTTECLILLIGVVHACTSVLLFERCRKKGVVVVCT